MLITSDKDIIHLSKVKQLDAVAERLDTWVTTWNDYVTMCVVKGFHTKEEAEKLQKIHFMEDIEDYCCLNFTIDDKPDNFLIKNHFDIHDPYFMITSNTIESFSYADIKNKINFYMLVIWLRFKLFGK